MTRAVLTDIEGTTSSIAFVTDVLFPYARARLADYIAVHRDELSDLLSTIPGDPLRTLLAWSDADRKETVLKDIQGRIWTEGYRTGELTGHVYPDAAQALRRWHAKGLTLAVFSSGSVAAQQLIFGYSSAGDLRPLFSAWFDTRTGPKREAASYRAIANALALAPSDVLFLSDTEAETAAANAAGMQAKRIDRQSGGGDIATFAEVDL